MRNLRNKLPNPLSQERGIPLPYPSPVDSGQKAVGWSEFPPLLAPSGLYVGSSWPYVGSVITLKLVLWWLMMEARDLGAASAALIPSRLLLPILHQLNSQACLSLERIARQYVKSEMCQTQCKLHVYMKTAQHLAWYSRTQRRTNIELLCLLMLIICDAKRKKKALIQNSPNLRFRIGVGVVSIHQIDR